MNLHHDRKDLLWFTFLALIILILGSLPDWIAHSAETDDLLFRGLFSDQADYSVHVSMMQAGRMGDWAYQMRFTTEPHQPAFLRMFYLILGHISKWIGLEPEPTYHLARWVFGFAALYSIRPLCQRFFLDRTRARLAFLFITLGSGLGWLQLMLGAPLEPVSPIDFWLIDAYVFFSVSLFPSFSFTLMLMAAAVNLFLDYLESPNWQKIIWISLISVASQATNPIAFAPVDAALVGAILFKWWNERKVNRAHIFGLGIIAFAQLPLLFYNFIVLSRDPVWSQYTFQNQTLSPPPSFYLWGFAMFWPGVLFGIYRGIKKRLPAWGAIIIWTLSGFLLAYLPVLIQRRFLLGITIPLGLLATFGLLEILDAFSKSNLWLSSRKTAFALLYILLASISSLYLVLGLSLHMQTRPETAFYPNDLEGAYLWLNQNASPNDFVLSDMRTGQILGQRTQQKAYLGHEMETLYIANKSAIVQAFYQGLAPPDWLPQTPIRWVIYGPYEQKLSPDFQPDSRLKIAYQNKTVILYEVNSP